MNLSTPVKVLALVVFLAALAGATYGVQQVLGDGVEGQLVTAQSARATLNATPGHTVTYVVALANRGDAEREVTAVVSGEGGIEGRAPAQRLSPAGNATAFVPVRVPEGLAPGEYPLSIRLVDETNRTLRERPDALTLRVLAPEGQALAMGETAQVVYVGRIAESGRVFAANDAALRGVPVLRTETYQPGSGLLNVSTVGPSPLPRGAVEALVGMVEGETRTITLTPEQGFGNATVEETIPRTQTLERRETLDLPTARLSTAEFAGYIQETGQGDPAGFEVGDLVANDQQGSGRLFYRIVSKSAEGVDLRLDINVGERHTVYPFWPNGSVVEEVTETTATFYTTPTTGEGEGFTFLAYWPELTRVVRMDEESITLRHDPPQGLKYTRTVSQFQPPRQYTVVSVGEDAIVVSTPSGEPLAGRELTYDLTLVGIRR